MEKHISPQNESEKMAKMQYLMNHRLHEFQDLKAQNDPRRHQEMQQKFMHLENLYKNVPQSHYVELEVAASAYRGLIKEDKPWWLRKENAGNKSEFFIKVDSRREDISTSLDSDKTVVNLVFLGGAMGTKMRFGLIEKSRDSIIPHKSLKPDEVIRMKIKKVVSKS